MKKRERYVYLVIPVILFLLPAVGLLRADNCPEGDITNDCAVDLADLQALAGNWLAGENNPANLDGLVQSNVSVDLADFKIMAGEWLVEGAPLSINEFMAFNNETLAAQVDGVVEYPDWIEIYNPTGEPVDLTGWHLTDDKDNLVKWRFPSGIILGPAGEANCFLTVFASGKTLQS